jgi:hypothetical protein
MMHLIVASVTEEREGVASTVLANDEDLIYMNFHIVKRSFLTEISRCAKNTCSLVAWLYLIA